MAVSATEQRLFETRIYFSPNIWINVSCGFSFPEYPKAGFCVQKELTVAFHLTKKKKSKGKRKKHFYILQNPKAT